LDLERDLPKLSEGGEERMFLDLSGQSLWPLLMGPCTGRRLGSTKPQVLLYLGIFCVKIISSYYPFLDQNTGFFISYVTGHGI